ncbi:structure-specific endonuclease subunit SLX4 [Pseudoloma neurophilia]|uniref:Structure-specific endonuclease subunit SLX4 n=1 Tax=Pseudoloma neurophilia TaxID=146866 RepID=A0A0R0M2Y0_9MICR|nr:structure-specific endonuclease subunit SLX4 [Pseudoloma neurophilia]
MDNKKLIIILGVLAAVIASGGVGLVFWLKSGDKESKTETKKTTPTAAQSQKEDTPGDKAYLDKQVITSSQPNRDDTQSKQTTKKDNSTQDTTKRDNSTQDTTKKDNSTQDTTKKDNNFTQDTTKKDNNSTQDTTEKDNSTKDTTKKDNNFTQDTTEKDNSTQDTTEQDNSTQDTTKKDNSTQDTTKKDNSAQDTTEKDNSTKDTSKKDNSTERTTKKDNSTQDTTGEDNSTKKTTEKDTSHSSNAFDQTILSDPSKPLFKDDEGETCTLSFFNVIFRLLKDDFFDLFKEKDDKLAVNMLKLREEVMKIQKDQKLINEKINNLVEVLNIKYEIRICSTYYLLKHFLKYIVESNLDKDNKYFGVELKGETAGIVAERASNNRILPIFYYYNLIIEGDHMSFKSESNWGFTKKPKLIFIYYTPKKTFDENRNKHLKIQHEDKTDKSKTVYNLKGIVFFDKNGKYNSFFIKNNELYDQKTGDKQSITDAEIFNPQLLIYELSE